MAVLDFAFNLVSEKQIFVFVSQLGALCFLMGFIKFVSVVNQFFDLVGDPRQGCFTFYRDKHVAFTEINIHDI